MMNSMSRRTVLTRAVQVAAGGALAAALTRTQSLSVFAQDATPVTGADLGLSELEVTITDSGYELSTTSVPAGYVLLTVHNASTNETGAAVLGPAPGQTLNDLQQSAATPAPNNGFPPFLYTATVAGGPGDLLPQQAGQAIIQLTEGDWVVFGEGDQPPTPFTATAGSPTAQTEPNASVTVTETEFAFNGLDGAIPAGQQTWKVVNSGAQPHMLALLSVPAGTTMDQLMQAISMPENATPVPGGLNPAEVGNAGGVLLQSTGTTVWPILNLPAGTYVAICFVTDPKTGMPHAMEGMVSIFEVGGSATPTA